MSQKECLKCNKVSLNCVECPCCKKRLCNLCNQEHLDISKSQLGKMVTTLKRHLETNHEICQKFVQCKSSIDCKKNEIILSINDLIDQVTVLLHKRKVELLDEVNRSFEDEYRSLQSLLEIKEVDKAVLSSSIHSTINAVDREDISHSEVISVLNSIQMTLPLQSNETILKDFERKTKEFSFDISQAENCLSRIGELRSISDIRPGIISASVDNLGRDIGSTNVSSNSERRVLSSAMCRDKTYILDRPVKSESMNIPVHLNECLLSRYQAKSHPIVTFGSKGVGPGEFIWPRGVVVDYDNSRIIVADSSNHRVQIFSDDGKCQKVISELYQTSEQTNSSSYKMTFDCLSGISLDHDNRILCSDRYNHRVVIIDREGHLLKEIGKTDGGESLLSFPWGIATDSRNNVLVCDKDNHRVQIFSKTGEYIKQIGSNGRQQGFFDNPHYLSVCPATQNIFVSDTSNHRIQVFSKSGDFINSFTGSGSPKYHLKYPRGIAIDMEGNVLVCDSGNNRISIFTSCGNLVHMIGSHGSGDGQFKGLEGISVFKDGRIVVSDRDNHRIQIF